MCDQSNEFEAPSSYWRGFSGLLKRWREYADHWDTWAGLGRDSQDMTLRCESPALAAKAGCLRDCAKDLEQALAAEWRNTHSPPYHNLAPHMRKALCKGFMLLLEPRSVGWVASLLDRQGLSHRLEELLRGKANSMEQDRCHVWVGEGATPEEALDELALTLFMTTCDCLK